MYSSPKNLAPVVLPTPEELHKMAEQEVNRRNNELIESTKRKVIAASSNGGFNYTIKNLSREEVKVIRNAFVEFSMVIDTYGSLTNLTIKW